jgi:Astacin (Peptidase family M12A)
MDTIEKYTCVRFRKRTAEKDYVSIIDGKGCHSNMGKIGGKQEVSLQKNGCFSKGTIMHEFIHALGYDHMHSSADRDRYVEIVYANIRPEAVSNFDRVNPKKFSNFGTEYDLFSVMHYDKKAFSKNGQDTIVPKNRRFAKVIGQRVGLSKDDVKRINNMYECAAP